MAPQSHPLGLEVRDLGHSIVVRFRSHIMLDCQYFEVLREKLFHLAMGLGERSLVLDFAEVAMLYSDVLALLISLHKRLRTTGGHLILCNLRPEVFEVFEITHLHKILDIRKGDQAPENIST